MEEGWNQVLESEREGARKVKMFQSQQQMMQQQQMMMQQQQPVPTQYYSIDIECVATGRDHNSRAVAQISLIDQYERVSKRLSSGEGGGGVNR